jgi:tetratricopeptide (TPR) repeat protein
MSTGKVRFALTIISLGACLRGQRLDSSSPLGSQTAIAPIVRGEIWNLIGYTGDLTLLLCEVSGPGSTRAKLSGDVTFEFESIPLGAYTVRLIRGVDEVIMEQPVQIGASGSLISLEFPEQRQRPTAGTVSADQLRHPLSGKAAKIIRNALEYGQSGDHQKAIEELRRALKEPLAAPYAHSLLGAEYLKTNQVAAARDELEQAVQLLPHDVADHSNFGYALFLSGDRDRAEKVVRRALDLDPSNSGAQLVLKFIVEARRKQE